MRYRTKLYIALVSISLASTLIAIGVLYTAARRHYLNEMRNKVLSIAATAATGINGDLVKKIKSREDENSAEYAEVKEQLRKIRDANRRKNVYVKYIYTLLPLPGHPHQLMFQIDAEEDPKNFFHVGDINPEANLKVLSEHLEEYYTPPKFVEDQWGLWLSGFAPIRDSSGNYVATLAVDLRASDVRSQLDELIIYSIWALLGSLALALTAAFVLSDQVTRSLELLCICVGKIGKGHLNFRAHLDTNDEFNDLALAINDMGKGLKERERLKTNFARYVSHHVFEKILASDVPTRLEGERKKITVLFADIRQFTLIAEQLPPEAVVSLLNEYFEKMLDIIFKHMGTLDKFLGDGLMVEFGAPIEDHLQEEHAIQTAIEMQQELKRLSSKWTKENKPVIEIGIGIHTGVAVVGNIGSEKRMEYTAIGDTVNVASRLQQASKTLHTQILVSEMTYYPVKDKFTAKNLGSLTLPGRVQEITVYAIEIPPS